MSFAAGAAMGGIVAFSKEDIGRQLLCPCRVMLKLGPRMDMGAHVPNDKEWKIVTWGKDFAVWERKN